MNIDLYINVFNCYNSLMEDGDNMKKTVVELFAGVGGFRVGLNKVTRLDDNGRAIESNEYNFVWSNQWEPSTIIQPAYECYIERFGNSPNHTNIDISQIN